MKINYCIPSRGTLLNDCKLYKLKYKKTRLEKFDKNESEIHKCNIEL